MKTTCFIPAKAEDNPLYGQEKIDALKSQTEDVQRKLLMGCWCNTEGAFFPFLNQSYIVPYSECGEQWWNTHFLSMDYGFSGSAAATGLYFLHENGLIFKIQEDTQRTMYSDEYAHHITRIMLERTIGGRRIRLQSGYADPAMDSHTGTGQSNLEIINGIFPSDFQLMKASKDSVGNAQYLAGKLRRREYVICDTCPKTYESLSSRKTDPERPGAILKVKGDELDDILDTDLYGLNNFAIGDKKPDEVAKEERLKALKDAGADDRSLNVARFRMEREYARAGAPVTMGRPTIGRIRAGKR
jgi:hypothetical protein